MIILFVNIKLLIYSLLSKEFPGQLHEALRKLYWYDIGFKCVCKSGSVGRVRRYLRQIVLSLGIPGSSPTVYFSFFFCFFFNFISLSFIIIIWTAQGVPQ